MSLYRKYRPQTFEDVVGQEHIAQTLRNALSSDPLRVAHAYLFCGPRGTGKTTSARLLAKCLNCAQGPTPTPCNQCDFCTRVRDNQTTMDLVEIDAASNTGVDNVRENIIEKVNVAPAQGRYRVYIIDEVHMLSTSSFNALLKTLEEPPAHAVFVLATTDAHKVPPTISSRCQRFDFKRVGPSDIAKRLHYVADHEGIALDDTAARIIARTADGGLRDALTLLEQVSAFGGESITEADVRLVLGTVSSELLTQIMDAVAERDAKGVLQTISQATEQGVAFGQLTRDLINYGRELLLLTVGFEDDNTLTPEDKQRRHDHAQAIGRARLMSLVETLRAAEKEMRQSTDQRLLLELALVRATADDAMFAPQTNGVAAPPTGNAARQGQSALNGTPPTPNTASAWRQPQRPAQRPAEAVETSIEAAPLPSNAVPVAEAPPAVTPPVEETVTATQPPSDETVPMEAEAEVAPATVPIEAAPVAEAPEVESEDTAEVPVESEPPSDLDTAVEAPAAKRKVRRIHDLDEFVELWPKVLLRVRKKIGVTAVAYLHDARPIELTETAAVLEFRKEFHYAKACEAAKRLPFEQVVNECLATPHILKFQLAERKPPAPAAPPPEPEPSNDDDDDESDIFEKAQAMFGAEVVAAFAAELKHCVAVQEIDTVAPAAKHDI